MKYINSYYEDLGVSAHLCETNITNKYVFPPGLSKDQRAMLTTFQKHAICRKVSPFSRAEARRVDASSRRAERKLQGSACLLRFYCLSTDLLWVGPSSSSVQFKRDCGISLEWHRYSIVSDFKRILTGSVYLTSYTSLFPPLVSFETFLGAEEIFWGTLQHD